MRKVRVPNEFVIENDRIRKPKKGEIEGMLDELGLSMEYGKNRK